AGVDSVKPVVGIRLHRQPQASQPTIDELNEIPSHALISLINQRVAIDIYIPQSLITGGIFPLLRADDGHTEAMATQAGSFLPNAPVKRHRQILHDDQDVSLG